LTHGFHIFGFSFLAMESVLEFFKQLVNPESIIHYGGLYLLLFVVFAETGLFFGFFLPGDSLLFTAGLLCATGELEFSIFWLTVMIIVASFLGNMVGYSFGKRMGEFLFKRKSSLFFRREHLETAKEFYEKHGGKAIVLCRFLPIVRTFAPIIAGIVSLNYKRFSLYNFIGALLWVSLLVLCGYYLGIHVPVIKHYLGYIVIFLISITSIPFIYRFFRKRKSTQ
jgi:membrane-associated protein